MEEVDGIIVHSLRQIGCELDEDMRLIGQFTTDQVVEAVARCLHRCAGANFTANIPAAISTIPMTARLRIGTSLAHACQELDYPGEVGYQTFLYWDEGDIRRLLMFLIEKMPKEAEKSVDEPLGSSALLDVSIAAAFKRTLDEPWLPEVFHFKHDLWDQNYSRTRPFRSSHLTYPKNLHTATKESKRFYDDRLEFVSDQLTSASDLAACVIEANEESVSGVQAWESDWKHRGLEHEFRAKKKQQITKKMAGYVQRVLADFSSDLEASSSVDFDQLATTAAATSMLSPKSSDSETVPQETAVNDRLGIEADEKDAVQARLKAECDRLESLNGKLESHTFEGTRLDAALRQMTAQTSQLEGDTEKLDAALSLRKRTLALLPDADSNAGRLQAVIEASVARLQALSEQWDEHRQPLVDRYRKLRETSASRVSETQRKLEEIRSLREKMKEIADDARTKGEVHNQLIADYEKMTKDFNRSAYTRRILEIVANIKKQKLDIDKVLIDTREVQKEINQLSGKLDRTFAVTDELIFKDAKKDESVRKAYKYLAALHENCSLLVKTVEETGAIMREIRDLEDQIENENRNKVLANLERISADYKQMRQENAALVGKLKAAQSSSDDH